jgi:myo-inositol 2-dehydrogenase/D-chiro-inositol 1-dehydrogenase
MDDLRIGFIGCGTFATGHLWPCLRHAPVEIAWACARGPERAEANMRRFGAEQATTDVGEVLGDDTVAAVFVVGPPAMHHELGLRVLEAGKHLFVEKPAGETLAHALDLQDAARRNGVQCQVGFQKRAALAYRRAREAMTSEAFGGLRLAKVNYAHWRLPDWRTHLTVMSSHGIDLARWFLGDPHEAHVLKRTSADGGSTCVLTLLNESGASAVVNLSSNEPHVQEWVELAGNGELVTVRNLVEYRHWKPAGDPISTFRATEPGVELWHPEFAIPFKTTDSMWLQGYAGEVVDFVQAVLEGRPVSPSIDDGVAAMRIAEAILDAPEGMSQLPIESEAK